MRVEPTRFHNPWTTIAAARLATSTRDWRGRILDEPRADAGPGDGRRDDVHAQAEQSEAGRDDGPVGGVRIARHVELDVEPDLEDRHEEPGRRTEDDSLLGSRGARP